MTDSPGMQEGGARNALIAAALLALICLHAVSLRDASLYFLSTGTLIVCTGAVIAICCPLVLWKAIRERSRDTA